MGGTVHLRGADSPSILQDNGSLEDVSATSQKIQPTPDEIVPPETAIRADEAPHSQDQTTALPLKTAAPEFIREEASWSEKAAFWVGKINFFHENVLPIYTKCRAYSSTVISTSASLGVMWATYNYSLKACNGIPTLGDHLQMGLISLRLGAFTGLMINQALRNLI